jgi:HAD superfamily hydrolase (TIGR01509 family)
MSRRPLRFDGVVFDLDGTLLDTMPFVVEGLTKAVAPYRSRPTPEEVMGSLGGPSDACVRRLLGGTRHLRVALLAYLEFLRQHDHVVRPFRGARTLLKFLKSESVRIGLWTGRERKTTLERLRALSWERAFDPVVCGDDLSSHKPDPEGLLKIVRSWQLAPAQVIFVGDSDQDFAGGCAAGVPTVAIDHGRRIASGLLRHPLAVAPNPPSAYARVRKLIQAGRVLGGISSRPAPWLRRTAAPCPRRRKP